MRLLMVALCFLVAVFGTTVFIANEEGKSVEEMTTAMKTEFELPPIDLAAPVQTQTATFGLG